MSSIRAEWSKLMSALPSELPSNEARPAYDADAYVFSAELVEPIRRKINDEAFVELPRSGGYKFDTAEPRRVDGIVSHGGGYAQVAGHRGCQDRDTTTLATAALEDLNLLDVLTADRVVAQITTEHPDDGCVPSVSFLGTRFENLRIGGQKIELEPHLEILGPKPDGDESYFNDGGVFSRIAHQYANIKRMAGLPKWASDQFNWDPAAAQSQNEISCSLVNGVSGSPGKTFGHVIELPHFGKIFLAELTVKREPANNGPRLEPSTAEEYKYRFILTMIRVELDGAAHGRTHVCRMKTNGKGKGGG
jgi:hypothetical protein